MLKARASDFARNFGRYREAVQREPVAVTSHGRISGVMVSPQDFEEFQRLKRMATRSLWADELSEESLSALENARMDEAHSDLDRLMGE